VRRTLELGLRRYSREELEAVKTAGGKLHIQVVGLAAIAKMSRLNSRFQQLNRSRPWRSSRQQAVKAALADRIG